MSIDNFFTAQIAQNPTQKGNGISLGKSSAHAQTHGLNFFGAFLNEAFDALKTNGEKDLNTNIQQQEKTEIITALAVNEDVEEQLALIENPELADVIALNQKALEEEIIPISDDLIVTETLAEEDIETPTIEDALLLDNKDADKPALNNLHKLLQRIEGLIESDSAVFTALNISPEQLTKLKADIQALVTKLENGEDIALENTEDTAENFGGLLSGLVKLMPPQSKQDVVITGKGLGRIADAINNNVPQQTPQNTQTPTTNPSNDVAARLNGLSIGANDKGFPVPPSYGDGEFDDFEQALKKVVEGKDGKGANIEDILKNAGNGKSEGAENAAKNAQTSILKGWPFSLEGSLFSSANFSDSVLDSFGIPTGQSSITSLASMTSVVTQGQSAAHPHPGTQIVAASIKKMAGSGETKNIRVQLDPPELGRVEIKMSFNKDKTVKAIFTAEKPETFMMMQRDSQVLERALQDAGIDTDGSELSFEMAQDEQDFGQDGSHDGSRNKTGNGNNAEGDDEIIETTMTWHVDPDSGHMRYNILA